MEISSAQLANQGPDLRDQIELTTTHTTGTEERSLQLTDQVIRLAAGHAVMLENCIRGSLENFGNGEDTLVQELHGLPSLLARVDFTIDRHGIEAFECDERPAGIGITDTLMAMHDGIGLKDPVLSHFDKYFGGIPVVARHLQAAENDDHMVFEEVSLADAAVMEEPLLARGEPHDFAQLNGLLKTLTERSVSTILTEGSKDYATRIPGFGSQIATVDVLPDASKSFVIKPRQGSKGRGVMLCLTPEDRRLHGKKSAYTHGRVTKAVAEAPAGSLLVERFKPPMVVSLKGGVVGNMILRVFGAVHPDGDVDILGGTFVARPELKVHGASNAIAGAVIV